MHARPLLLTLALILASCGYVGDPMPPSLHIPAAVADLRAEQKVDRIEIRFTLPPLTTDNAGIRRFQDVELQGGPEGAAGRIPLPPAGPGPVELTVPVADWSGKSVTFKVRSQGIRGRWSEWSNAVTLAVAAPAAAPMVRATATAAGVKLEWDGPAGTTYTIERTSEGSPAPVMLGPANDSTFLDKDAQFNQSYTYRVQSAGSPMSAPVVITPKDTFPPATPTGLSAIAAPASIQLSWNPVEDADLAGYQMYRAEGDGPFIRVGGRLTAPSFNDREVRPAISYRYRVTALDSGGNESPPSEASTIAVP
ncbi:MAG: hypothetical protein ABI972_03800 [Acidobacteriota bacterium]